jgi:outer membrane immunogenic protein
MRASTIKAIATAAFAAMAASSVASAADMAPRYTKAPPAMVEIWNWTGFYIGGNVGYSWGRSNSDVSYFSTVNGLPIAPPPGSVTSASFDMNGAIAGVQAGYNWQTGSSVWGVEADIQWSGEKGRTSYLCASAVGGPCTPGLTAPPLTVLGTSLALDQSLEWFGTARLRGGFLAAPRVLLYATGGLAYGSIKTTGSLAGVTANLLPVAIIGSSSETRLGWTVGAGVEGMITQNWTAKLEYLYMDLGRYNSLGVSLAPVLPIGVNVSSHFTDHILRAGINYKFGGPVVAKY